MSTHISIGGDITAFLLREEVIKCQECIDNTYCDTHANTNTEIRMDIKPTFVRTEESIFSGDPLSRKYYKYSCSVRLKNVKCVLVDFESGIDGWSYSNEFIDDPIWLNNTIVAIKLCDFVKRTGILLSPSAKIHECANIFESDEHHYICFE